jgi:hypothetical protein
MYCFNNDVLGEILCLFFCKVILSSSFKKDILSQVKWVMSVIQATQDVELGKITVLGQPRQKVDETPSQPIIKKEEKKSWGQVLVAYAHNPRYPGGRNQDDHGSRSAWANGL